MAFLLPVVYGVIQAYSPTQKKLFFFFKTGPMFLKEAFVCFKNKSI